MRPEKGQLITRRRVILGGVGLGSALAVVAMVRLPGPAPGMKLLARSEQDLVASLGEVLFPPGNPVGPSWKEIDLVAEVDRILSEVLPSEGATGFRYLLSALDWSAYFVAGKPFRRCTPLERLELIEVLEQRESVLRRAARDGLRGVFSLAYFDHPEVWRAIGFRSRCTGEPA